MAKPSAQDKIFEDVLQNAEDISAIYNDNRALQRKLTDAPQVFENFLAQIRDLMILNGGIHRIDSVDPQTVANVEQAHSKGLIAAIDGTDALPPTEVSSRTVYAVGVISTTARTLNEPHVSLTSSHRVLPTIQSNTDLIQCITDLDQWVDHEQSWTRTFREDCERKEALRLLCDPDIALVLIDGPLYTQNLLTQTIARNGILAEMNTKSDRLIGFIKNIHSSKIMHLAGMALQPGEYWTLDNWRDALLNRFRNNTDVISWVTKAPSTWSRTVYRKGAKAFAFECYPSLVAKGLALIHSPVCCASILNHEIPFLLHAADRIIQTRMDARAKSDNLISSSPFYASLANERIFR